MTYLEMCRYIVAKEGYNWKEFVSFNSLRKEELVEVRQICFYFGWKYFKSLSYSKMGSVFGKDHATVMYAIRTAQRDIKVEGSFKRKITAYDKKISEILSTYRLKDDEQSEEILKNLMTSIDQMRIIADAYCKITGYKIVKIV